MRPARPQSQKRIRLPHLKPHPFPAACPLKLSWLVPDAFFKKEKPCKIFTLQGFIMPALTYFRLSTIIGLLCLASEFGMGSGVSTTVRTPANSLHKQPYGRIVYNYSE